MNVLFRADGGAAIGMGHLVRSHALAHALEARGARVRFLTVPGAGRDWLQAQRVEVDTLDFEPGTPADATQTGRSARERAVRAIVTDGYAFRAEYLAELAAAGIKVASIDDLAGWPFPSALVVNGGFGASELCYQTAPGAVVLLGPNYLLLRRPFRLAERAGERIFPPTVRRMLACFGGSDPLDWTGLVLDVWAELPERPALDLVVGPAYERLPALAARATACGASVHHDLPARALAERMAATDLAVASCGMVAGELMALGVPAVLGVMSPDQGGNAATLRATGAARVVDPFHAPRVREALAELLTDRAARVALSEAGGALVDGRGSERVAEAVLALGTAS